ncbi:hypothetical protein BLOT_007781 [Blomia tropicalis]|nr:hypothetical protein BLOT_007781 [Blomia tropicalis]
MHQSNRNIILETLINANRISEMSSINDLENGFRIVCYVHGYRCCFNCSSLMVDQNATQKQFENYKAGQT